MVAWRSAIAQVQSVRWREVLNSKEDEMRNCFVTINLLLCHDFGVEEDFFYFQLSHL